MREREGPAGGNGAYEAVGVPLSKALEPIFIDAERLGYFICPWQSDSDDSFYAGVCDIAELTGHRTSLDEVPELFTSGVIDCAVCSGTTLEDAIGNAFLKWHQRKKGKQIQRLGLRVIEGGVHE